VIYVRVELWPGGCRSKAEVLNEATITNVGGNEELAVYHAEISDVGGFKMSARQKQHLRRHPLQLDLLPDERRVRDPLLSSVMKRAKLEFERRLGPLELLCRALKACGIGKGR